MVGRILRLFSYLFHALLALFLIGLAIVSIASDQPLRLEMLPLWKSPVFSSWLLGAATIGLVSLVLAITGTVRFLFPVYAFTVLALLVRGFLLQPYTFSGRQDFYWTLCFIGAALLAFLFSLSLFARKKRRRL